MIGVDRRRMIGGAGAALGLLGTRALAVPMLSGFTHGVASGEPGPDGVLLWTRYVGKADAKLRCEVAETPDFRRIVAGGDVIAGAASDHTAKLAVRGLRPGRWYAYRFIAPDGTRSQTGRTRTLPDGPVDAFTLGVFSCANIGFGRFNAYGHAAARDDIDLMLHLGDYQYEYHRGDYPSPAEAVPGRIVAPPGETVHLADYRARYAAYRTDPDLRAIHARFPMIMMWDDHESANDSWQGGAENHDPATEGDWGARKAAAVRAYREWMPVSDDDWKEYRIGTLAALFRPEERLTARTKQVSLGDAIGGQADLTAALTRFRDTIWADPAHTLMGADQERWFADRMQAAAATTRWQVFAQQVNVGYTRTPADAAADWAKSGDKKAVARLNVGMAAAKLGLPFNMDSWNGYPAARSRMLRSGLDADANLVVLSGDSHNAWAFDLAEGDAAAGVEFGVQSVTSPGFEHSLRGVDPAVVARGLVAASPELRWADTSGRGYMTVRLTPDRVTTDWLFVDTVLKPSRAIARAHRASAGARRAQIVGMIALALALAAAAPLRPMPRIVVIAHRGAAGERPEHTLEAYRLAIAEGADFIEPDLVMTKDRVLVARHENEISGTTDVAARPEFAARKTTKTIDGEAVTGWFTEDFTLADLKTLRARERLPALRPGVAKAYDGRFPIPTFAEILDLVAAARKASGRAIGVYPEIKHGTYFAGIGLAMERPLIAALATAGYTKRSDPVIVQSFEIGNLKALHRMTKLRLVQLVASEGAPYDRIAAGDRTISYATMTTPAGLKAIAAYAQAIGPEKVMIVPRDAAGRSLPATTLVRDAHAAGLVVHPWTFRSENEFLPLEARRGGAPAAHGDAAAEYRRFLAAGVDGLFSEFPAEAVAARSGDH